MTISDVLFEAREDILGYLAAGVYGERERWTGIAAVVLAMDKLRLSPGYDVVPGWEPPKLPEDPMEHLDAVLAEWVKWKAEHPFDFYCDDDHPIADRHSIE